MDARQYARNPCRCQRTTVSGLMMGSSEEPGTQAIEPNQQKPIDIAQRQPLAVWRPSTLIRPFGSAAGRWGSIGSWSSPLSR
jgi:hypothetical protein